jgi:two-component sensor histidine kinase
MTERAAFAGIALRVVNTEKPFQQALEKQKQLTVEQMTLAQEMDHRVMNLFAIVDGLIHVSARAATTPEEMSKILSGRFLALVNANRIVCRTSDQKGIIAQGSGLSEIVPTILRPHEGTNASGRNRFDIEGPPVRLGDRSINGFALVLYELATNAAKYGALTVEAGSIQVRWRLEQNRVVLTWQECGGPVIDGEPTKQGFGSVLSRNTVVGQLGGTLRHDWHPAGLLVTVSVPFENLSN